MTSNPLRQLKSEIFTLVLLVLIGSAGYVALEGWSFLDGPVHDRYHDHDGGV